ncbi:RNA 2',3'-cyclic phosphodiesterase [Tepidibacter thalassicus]|uniref:RNA 2',3'-cyclic phosphodiesterase n=1 Tax=Tepidibacter thalassicus DSM 15285 TaxID=1123350 RepID=A0A1M5QFS3_9FIRM|nr:RNA 2',3'-cyclic phosphodiesterase [Tepidibacter thalassicus]SHH12917.1 2'-5' RNA ligase [Tepidibacter thalassicus DSM 15285]
MRLFIGIYPPKEIIEYIYNIEEYLISKGIIGNYTKKENIHLTLKFLGETEEYKLSDIKKILNNYKKLNIHLKIDKISYFKRNNQAILWIGLSGDIEKLTTNVINLNDDLLKLGFQKETKKFKPHITIARKVKLDNLSLRIINNIQMKGLNFKINEINLIKSTLTKKGPIYETLY